MILNELVLHNVGTFAGRHVLDLTPPSAERPIVLIGGLNGAGKTTILEAIQLVLYGPLFTGSGRRTGSYDSYLSSLIHRGVPQREGAAISLRFTAFEGGVAREYWVQRSWKSTGASIREILLVTVDGRHSQSLHSTWNEYIETFLPRGVAGLFFFDGEQIEALADLDRSREVLGSALAALLGLDLVDRLEKDLLVLRRRHRINQLDGVGKSRVDEQAAVLSSARTRESEATESVSQAQRIVAQAEFRLTDATEAFRGAGGDLFEQRESLQTAADATNDELRRLDADLRHALAGPLPLLQVEQLLRQVSTQVAVEEATRRNQLLAQILEDRDHTMLDALSKSLPEATLREISALFKTDRDARASTEEPTEVVGPLDAAHLHALLQALLPAAKQHVVGALTKRAALQDRLDIHERTLAAVPASDAIAAVHAALIEASEEWQQARLGAQVAEATLATIKAERERAAIQYERALEDLAREELATADDQRLVLHLERVRETLARLRVEATEQHLDRISYLVVEALRQLFRKESLVTDVHIDPVSNELSLTGIDGHAMSPKQLSAGERQLLAVALLWGLARASGQPLPVVIDTPLGRLDASHRRHLLERYFPHASHQVVLLSTDTEIDHAAYQAVRHAVGHAYHLDFDPATNSTQVQAGYFWD